jgi:hypothetical protein
MARLDLTRIGFRLLTLLIERRGRTQSREALHSDVLGYQNPIITHLSVFFFRNVRVAAFHPIGGVNCLAASSVKANSDGCAHPPNRTCFGRLQANSGA